MFFIFVVTKYYLLSLNLLIYESIKTGDTKSINVMGKKLDRIVYEFSLQEDAF